MSEPLRTPTGYHIIRLNEVRGGSQKAEEDQVHVRHILMKTNELADDATVKQKLNSCATASSRATISQASRRPPPRTRALRSTVVTSAGRARPFAPEF